MAPKDIFDLFVDADDSTQSSVQGPVVGQREVTGLSREWHDLNSQYGNSFDNPHVTADEAFETWSHEQIVAEVTKMAPATINSAADAWRGIATEASTLLDAFQSKVGAALYRGWEGTFAAAAAQGISDYHGQARALPLTTQMIANRLDEVENFVRRTIAAVPPVPVETAASSPGLIPIPGAAKAAHHVADELEAQAQQALIRHYKPGVVSIDGQTPRIPQPYNPVGHWQAEDRSGNSNPQSVGGPGSAGPGGPSSTATYQGDAERRSDTTNPAGSPESDDAVADQSQIAADTPLGGGPDDQQSVQPTSSVDDPLSTRPTSTPDFDGPNPNSTPLDSSRPNSPGPSTNHPGPGSGPNLAGPLPVSLSPTPGAPGTAPTPAGSPGAPAPGRHGAPGMGGMHPPGARGRGEDDDEHKIPSYLVNVHNGNALIGKIDKVAPPVIGE